IVSEQHQRAHLGRGLLDRRENRRAARVVEALLEFFPRPAGKLADDALPGLAGAHGGGDQREIGDQPMVRHIGADQRRIALPARIEMALPIDLAGLGLLRLRVSQQHQAYGVILSTSPRFRARESLEHYRCGVIPAAPQPLSLSPRQRGEGTPSSWYIM